MGKVVAPAGMDSAVHHHGAGETAIYVLHGRVTFFFGEGLRERLEVQAGDYLFVPAWAIHAEGNRSGEDAEILVVRSTPEAIAVDLPGLRVPEDLLRPSARRGAAPRMQPRGTPSRGGRAPGAPAGDGTEARGA